MNSLGAEQQTRSYFCWCILLSPMMCLCKDYHSEMPRQICQKGNYSVLLSLKLMIYGSSFTVRIHVLFNGFEL